MHGYMYALYMRSTGAHEQYMHGHLHALYMRGTGAHERYMHGHLHAVRALLLATGYPSLVGGADSAGGAAAAGAGGARVGGTGGGAGAGGGAGVRVGGAGGGAGGGFRAEVGARDGHDPLELRQAVGADGQGLLQVLYSQAGRHQGVGSHGGRLLGYPLELRETQDGRKVDWW